ncbi:RNA-binding protein [Bacillus sp. Marseille-Q3570]|uniref:YlmH family RNA-binding protein n=1 Tax=Bacillus sp. Marseille-Q3570 TaxID=2963522 RepID=UPI0021B79819|nr:RNA-binding protein [Bacillus sp. Marseille-Q3570]
MSIYDHYRPEEQPFIDQVLEWRKIVLDQYRVKVTDFLDPREQHIIKSILGSNDEVHYQIWKGYQGIERSRALLYPIYYEPQDEDFEIEYLETSYPSKFVTLHHSDILGALMNLGLKRKKFGDILLGESKFQLIIASEVADYVRLNFNSVGKTSISAKVISPEKLIGKPDEWNTASSTVSSLRLDVVLSEVFRLSRSKAVPYITNKKVKLNWKVVEQPSSILEEGDHLSVRGLGRAKLISVDGKSKKGKWKVTFGTKNSK